MKKYKYEHTVYFQASFTYGTDEEPCEELDDRIYEMMELGEGFHFDDLMDWEIWRDDGVQVDNDGLVL